MEPQAPQITPDDQQPVVSSSQIPPADSGGHGAHSHKPWLVILVLVLVAAAAVVAFALLHHNSKPSKKASGTQTQTQNAKTAPAYGNIKVGSFRYVNACQALPAAEEEKVFAGLANSALIHASYAENTLPSNDIGASGHVASSCSREFGTDTPYGGTTITFEIDQYTTTAGAKKAFDTYNVSQANLDQANQQFGTDLSAHTVPLPGAEGSFYDTQSNSSYTLAGNKLVSFTALLNDVTVQQFQQAIAAALPAVLANVGNPGLNQQMNQETTFGQKIGEATYQNPCKFFTDADYRQITGYPDNPTDVTIEYNYNATTSFFTDIRSGEANNNCTRYGYPGNENGRSIEANLMYFKSAAEANQTVQANFTRRSGEEGQKLQTVNGFGQYAYFRQTTDGSGLSYFDVQKGPYILELSINLPSGTATQADYTKAANVLLPKLQ